MIRPNLSNKYNIVEINLFTHYAEDIITEKEISLSKAIEEICKKNRRYHLNNIAKVFWIN